MLLLQGEKAGNRGNLRCSVELVSMPHEHLLEGNQHCSLAERFQAIEGIPTNFEPAIAPFSIEGGLGQ